MFFKNNINNKNYNSSHSLYLFTILGFIFFSHSVMSDSCDPMDCSPPGSPVHGISQEEYWSGLPCPSPGDLPDSWDWTHVSCIGRQILYLWATSSVQSLSHVWLFATPWTSACQASLSITNFRTHTHVHWVCDAIQPSHPLLSPSPPALNLSQYQGLFKWVSSLHQLAWVLEFQLQHQSYQWTPRTDLL